MANHPNRSAALKSGAKVQSVPDRDFGTVKRVDRRDGMVLVAWDNGQETWASRKNLRPAATANT